MSDALANYRGQAERLRLAVAHLTAAQARERPVAGKWSVLELVCHLADFEPIYAERMKRAIALDEPPVLGADETAFAQKLVYHERDLAEELAVVAATRLSLARLLAALPAEAWGRRAVHNEAGPLTVRALLEKAVKHFDGHWPHLEAKLAHF